MGENLPAARAHHATGDIRPCKASKDRWNATRSDFVAVDQAVIFVELPDPAPTDYFNAASVFRGLSVSKIDF